MEFWLTDHYDADSAGGVCAFSGSARRPGERIIKTDVNVDDLPLSGYLFISEAVVALWAKKLGYITPGDADELHQELIIVTDQRDRWAARAKAQEALQEALTQVQSTMELTSL